MSNPVEQDTLVIQDPFKLSQNVYENITGGQSLLDVAIIYNEHLGKIHAENEAEFHKAIGSLDDLLEVAIKKLKNARKDLLSQYGEVVESAL